MGTTSRLTALSTNPWNAETVLREHAGVITPNHAFYKRNHFPVPTIDAAQWTLSLRGEVERPLVLRYEDLLSMERRSLTVTLECAGNGRTAFQPPAVGEPWEYGAVSAAEWTGVPLRHILEAAGLRSGAQEIVVVGADRGPVPDAGGTIDFARGMPLDRALHPDTLLAYAMNGETLPPAHGFPVRLVVPGWYGMASVKWVSSIEASAGAFRGFYQWDRYMLIDPDDEARRDPLREMRIRSLFTTPDRDVAVPRGRYHLRGLAWSGAARVERVEVSVDGGASWSPAKFTSDEQPYAWRQWEAVWEAEGPARYTVQCRAFDAAGTTQPPQPEWNRLGYANNAIQSISVEVT